MHAVSQPRIAIRREYEPERFSSGPPSHTEHGSPAG
jgi:hypothetical protein